MSDTYNKPVQGFRRKCLKINYDYKEKPDISYNPSDKRKYYRLTNVIRTNINGEIYNTTDWSVSACKINDYTGNLAADDETVVVFELKFQDFSINFAINVRVLRIDSENKKLILEYIDENPRKKEILSHFSQGIASGQLQAFEDVIRHIDIPITDNYLQETFKDDAEDKNFNFVSGFMIIFYMITGILLCFLGFKFIYSKINLMSINSAVVSVKTEELNSPLRGILSEIYVREGEYVEEGTPLFKVLNSRIQKEIEIKKNDILKNRAVLKEKQKKLQNLQFKLNTYKKEFSLKLDIQKKIIDSLSEKIDLLNEELAKKTLLYEKKIISKPEIDAVKRELIQQKREFFEANYEYFIAYSSFKDPENSLSLINMNKYNNSDDLKAEIERINDIINIDEQELEYIKSTNFQNIVKAPFKAFINKFYAFKGKYVDEKTSVVFLKDVSGKKLVEASIAETQALKLRIGIEVKIVVPSEKLELKGILTKLEKRQENFGKKLVIAIIKPDNSELLGEISDGTPAKVVFYKNNTLKFPSKFKGYMLND